MTSPTGKPLNLDEVTYSEARANAHIGKPPSSREPEVGIPTCPECKSDFYRCVSPDGGLVWPWHIRRQIRMSQQLLQDDDWLETASARQVLDHAAIVNAYDQGYNEGLADAS